EVELNISGSICVVRQFIMIVKTVVTISKTKRLVPFDTLFFPVFVPLHFFTGANKELHFHLFELTHTEDKLARHDFVTESFSGLCNSKWNLHAADFLYVQEVYKNTLSGFRTEIYGSGAISGRSHL